LDDEHVLAAHVLLDFHERLAVGERRDIAPAQFDADVFANCLGQGFVGGAAKNFHESKMFLVKTGHRRAGAAFPSSFYFDETSCRAAKAEKPPLSADEIAE
jgi:hypothetical protein